MSPCRTASISAGNWRRCCAGGRRRELLHTYSAERQAIAKELIDFDREWARMFSARPKAAADGGPEGVDAAEIQEYFVRQGRFTAGTATRYQPSMITAEPMHQHLAKGFVIGMRFHSAPVIRLADAKPVHLGHTMKADGRWRIFAFSGAGDPARSAFRHRQPVRLSCPVGGICPSGGTRRRAETSTRDRRAGGVPAGPSRPRHRDACLHFLLPRKGRLRASRLREDVLPRPEGR